MGWLGSRRAIAALLVLSGAVALVLAALWAGPVRAQGPGTGWSSPVIISNDAPPSPLNTRYPVVATTSDGAAHIFWNQKYTEAQTHVESIFYLRMAVGPKTYPVDIQSSLGGEVTNFPNTALLTPANLVNHSSNVALSPDGKAYMLWQSGWNNDHLLLSSAPISEMGTASAWRSPITVAEGRAIGGALAVDAHGTVHVIFYTPGKGLGIFYTRWDDGGKEWSDPLDISGGVNDSGIVTSGGEIAVSESGIIHAAWTVTTSTGYTKVGTPARAYYSRSIDGGRTWSRPLELDPTKRSPGVVDTPSIGVFGANRVDLVWYADALRRHQSSSDGGQTWSKPESIMGDVWGHAGNGMAYDSAGTLHVVSAGHDAAYLPDSVYYSSWDGKAWSALERIGDAGQLIPDKDWGFESPQIAVSNGNRLHVVWQDRDNIWYSTRLVDAPARPSVPVPTAEARPTVTASPTAPAPTAEPSPTARPPEGIGNTPFAPVNTNSMPALIWGLVPAGALVVFALLINTWRAR